MYHLWPLYCMSTSLGYTELNKLTQKFYDWYFFEMHDWPSCPSGENDISRNCAWWDIFWLLKSSLLEIANDINQKCSSWILLSNEALLFEDNEQGLSTRHLSISSKSGWEKLTLWPTHWCHHRVVEVVWAKSAYPVTCVSDDFQALCSVYIHCYQEQPCGICITHAWHCILQQNTIEELRWLSHDMTTIWFCSVSGLLLSHCEWGCCQVVVGNLKWNTPVSTVVYFDYI